MFENDREIFVEYEMQGGKMSIFETYVPLELRGNGLADRVILAAFEYCELHGIQVIPTCTYISEVFLKRHQEFSHLVVAS